MPDECTVAACAHCLFKPWCQNPLDHAPFNQAYQNLMLRCKSLSESGFDVTFKI